MTQLSKEYAVSLFSLAVEGSCEKEYLDELKFVLEIIERDPDYINLLGSPALTREERSSILDEAFGTTLSEYVMSFLKLLCEAGQIKLFPDCVAEFEKMYRDEMKTASVKVTSASALTFDETERIRAKVEKLVGGKCEISYKIDPYILGGAIIETENGVIDGSLRKSLNEMKEVIKK